MTKEVTSKERPPLADVLTLQAGALAGLGMALLCAGLFPPHWRDPLLVVGFGVGMAAVKLRWPENALVRGGGWFSLISSCAVVAVFTFLFEQPQSVGLSQFGVVIAAALVVLAVVAVEFAMARGRRSQGNGVGNEQN